MSMHEILMPGKYFFAIKYYRSVYILTLLLCLLLNDDHVPPFSTAQGMGGQLDYFGLWLSADYGKGHSKARPKCSTYGSPMLSSTEEFEIDVLEAWGVGKPELEEEEVVRVV